MTHNNPHITQAELTEIRRLLREWFEASISSEDESRLDTLLRRCAGSPALLPEDIRSDAEVFLSLNDLGNGSFGSISATDDKLATASLSDSDLPLPEMPEEYADRINAAMEEEFAKTRSSERIGGFGRRLKIGLRWSAACVASVAIAAGIFHLASNDAKRNFTRDSSAIAIASDADDNNNPTAESLPETEDNLVAFRNSHTTIASNKATSNKATSKSHWAKTTAGRSRVRHEVSPSGLTADEETKLLSANYQIVSDEAEAEAILATVFMRMQNNIEPQAMRLSEINSRFLIEKMTPNDSLDYGHLNYEPLKNFHDDDTKI